MQRHYGMDWLRIGAFALLILYHIGMFFVPWDWHVKTAAPVDWARFPMLATNAWRLPLLFLVSGFASAAILRKDGRIGAFVRSRSARLMIPTIFAMAVIIPPQPWVELQFKHGYAASYWHFWTADYFRFAAIDGIVVPTWQHLWFVVYLWVYTLALALLLALIPAPARAWLSRAADRMLGGIAVLLVPIALLLLHLWLSWPGEPHTHALVDDWQMHRVYFATFLFGLLLAHGERVWAGIRRWWWLGAVLAVPGYGVVVWAILPEPDHREAFEVARIFQGWGTIVALLGVADRWWNRDHRLRPMLTEGVFPFYIIHQTIIVVLGWYLLRLALPAGAEFAILLAATVAGCWLFYDLGRRIAPLRPLIGLRMRRPAKGPEPASTSGDGSARVGETG